MELFGGKNFNVEKIVDESIASKTERESMHAKLDLNRTQGIYECPKFGCDEIMLKVAEGDYNCKKCASNYTTFKFREQSLDESQSTLETSSKSDENGSLSPNPKRRCLRNGKQT